MSDKKKITKAVILAGGKGTRFKEYTKHIPKPLIQLGPYPILIHIMKRLHKSGIREFVICGGYKIGALEEWFIRHFKKHTDVECTEDYIKLTLDDSILEDTVVTIVNTGQDTGTAQRIKQIQPYLNQEDFVLCYGDSVSDVDFNDGYPVFESENKLISICAIPYVQPSFGFMQIADNGDVTEFQEKPQESVQRYINGGYMLVKYDLLDHIQEEHTDFAKDTLEIPDLHNKISAYIHRGYWKAIDNETDLWIATKHFEQGYF